jgi:hypothetical protein
MVRVFSLSGIILVLFFMVGPNSQAQQKPLSGAEFRQLYDSLLAGKTLVSEIKEDGTVVVKERKFGSIIDAGDGDFEVPVDVVITKTKDGQLEQKITVDIASRVSDVGGQAIISEEVRQTTVEKPGSETQTSSDVTEGGIFRVAGNEKGGFDVHSFGLMPTVASDGTSVSPTGSMVSYSCFSEGGLSKCILTIRQYKLGEYKPLVGYVLTETVGQDMVETATEAKQ